MVAGDSSSVVLQRAEALVLVLDTPKGRGVFASRDIPAYTVLDVCPVLVLSPEENKQHIEKTSLYHYTYNWPIVRPDGTKQTSQAVIFGLGSLFNHARDQNVIWERNLDRHLVTYRTSRAIRKDEELCISYGDRLTFKDADQDEESNIGDGSEILSSIEIDVE